MDLLIMLIIAFAAGFISILSPCILPLLPVYICYLSGIHIEDLTDERSKHLRILLNSVAFMLGFSLVFVALGAVAGLLGSLIHGINSALPIIGGILIIVFWIIMMHLVNIPFLDAQRNFNVHFRQFNLATSFILGMAFSVSWTPCTSYVLSSIGMWAATTASISQSVMLFGAYSLGLAVPFMFIGLFTRGAFQYIEKNQNILKYYNYIAGGLLVIIGILLILGRFWRVVGQIFGTT